MRVSLIVAACLAVVLAAAHSYLGERYLLRRLFRRDNLPKLLGSVEFAKGTLRFAWHITSIAWLGLACLIVVLATSPDASQLTQARIVASVFGVSGALALFASRGRHLSWVAFLAIAGLVWFGYP